MPLDLPGSQLSRSTVHEPSMLFPEELRIVLKWSANRATSITISADEFFGRGVFGAPINGDGLIQRIDALRKSGPK